MRVAMLGPFRLHSADGKQVDVGGPRVRALIARLALDAGRPVPAQTLISDLWGAHPPQGALNALQSLVSRARRAFEELVVRCDSVGYSLEIPADDVDVHRFDRLVSEARRAEPAGAAELLRDALRLCRGSPLVDFMDAPFAAPHAARLDEARLSVHEQRIEADLRLGRHAELVAELDGLCTRYPLRERLTSLRLRTLQAAGRQADALAAYEAHRREVADALGADPAEHLRELHAELLRARSHPAAWDPAAPGGDGVASAAGKVASDRSRNRPGRADTAPSPADPARDEVRGPHPGAPPPVLSTFIGRESEKDQLSKALRRSRLVTLFGPGGAGKTRLAIETAAGITGRRVRFVELAAVSGGNDLVSAVLAALGLRETRLLEAPQPRGAARVADALAAESAVLVLDNCEHVIEEAAGFAHELLGHCPDLTILATSREPLALAGEALLPVDPLDLPGDGAVAAESPAVRLFADRARSARPDFALDEHSTPDVVEVCRRLDGMPLAIELAAARLRSMSLRQVADRLDDRFRLLTSGNRTSMPRHRTLRAVVEWSWDLLTAQERLVARRMSVCTGAVRPESITAVCADAELPAPEVFYVLSSLVEKSLVTAVETDPGGRRYRMLETVRAYCAQQCSDAGESTQVRDAHTTHFLAVAEEAEPQLYGSDQVAWMDRLDADHDNLLAAVHWCVESGDAERGLRLGAALAWYWSMAAADTDFESRLAALCALPGEAAPQARVVVRLMLALSRRVPDWVEEVRDAVAEVPDSGASERYRYAAVLESGAWLVLGDVDQMLRAIERGLRHPSAWVRAASLAARSFNAESRGEPAAAEEDVRGAVEAFRAVGDRWGHTQMLGSLAGFRSRRGDHTGAIEILQESAASIRQLRSGIDLASIMLCIGQERVRAGELLGARADLEEGWSMARGAHPWFLAWALTGFAQLARRAGDAPQAHRYLVDAQAVIADMSHPGPARVLVATSAALLLLDENDYDQARNRLAQVLESDASVWDLPSAAVVAEIAAGWRLRAGDPLGAARMLGLAVRLRGVLDEGDPDVRGVLAELAENPDPETRRKAFDAGAALSREEAFTELRAALA